MGKAVLQCSNSSETETYDFRGICLGGVRIYPFAIVGKKPLVGPCVGPGEEPEVGPEVGPVVGPEEEAGEEPRVGTRMGLGWRVEVGVKGGVQGRAWTWLMEDAR
ncbi:hypothetical protein MRX96_018739 [Rhipicephalus microplus]